jgi:ADP-ribosyl-[dinitrogen reductase] hydrolase
LVLEASYEATLRVARIWQAEPVFLTLLGGGVFGNAPEWIEDAIVRAVERVPGVDVRIVSYGQSSASARAVVRRCSQRPPPESRGRTSASHPLRVDWVDTPGGPPVGLTFAPGKVQAHGLSGSWRRSLEADLDRLSRVYAVDELVCLVEDHELESLNITSLPERAVAHGIRLHRVPIQDGSVPSQQVMRALQERVRGWRRAGRRVVFHCMGGLGRAGTAGACCLVTEGVEADQALSRVRASRPDSVETAVQEAFIRDYQA